MADFKGEGVRGLSGAVDGETPPALLLPTKNRWASDLSGEVNLADGGGWVLSFTRRAPDKKKLFVCIVPTAAWRGDLH